MKKTFQKTLIGAALVAAGLSAVAGTRPTTNLLFPYVTTATGSYTFISIVANQFGANPAAPFVHMTYATKAISAANSAACAHLDGDAIMTANDLMQFEIQNKVNMPAAFGDVTSVPKYFPLGAGANDRHGFLIVNNDAAAGGLYGGSAAYLNAALNGEAHIINTATGLGFGYSIDDLHTTGTNNPDFASTAGPDGGDPIKAISWFPDPAVSTTWYVLPLGTETTMGFGGNLTKTYKAYNWSGNIGGHYNNNEGFQSSTAQAAVTCLGVFDRATLLGALNAPWSANGGWAAFAPSVLPVLPGDNTLIYKMETTTALGGLRSFVSREPLFF